MVMLPVLIVLKDYGNGEHVSLGWSLAVALPMPDRWKSINVASFLQQVFTRIPALNSTMESEAPERLESWHFRYPPPVAEIVM